MILIIIIVVMAIVIFILRNRPSKAIRTLFENVKQTMSCKGSEITSPCKAGIALGEFVKKMSSMSPMYRSEQERLEIWYLLIYELDQILTAKYPEDKAIILDAFKAHLFISGVSSGRVSNRAVKEYQKRGKVYSLCPVLTGNTGACVGTRMLALSYFLQQSRHETFGGIPIDVITGKKDFSERSDDFLDPFEATSLTLTVSNYLISLTNMLRDLERTKPIDLRQVANQKSPEIYF